MRDLARAGGVAPLASVQMGLGDELWPVDAADARRGGVEAAELLQHVHHILGFAPPANPDRQAGEAVVVVYFHVFRVCRHRLWS